MTTADHDAAKAGKENERPMNEPQAITLPSDLRAFEVGSDIVVAFSEKEALDYWTRETGIPANETEISETTMDYLVHVGETADSPVCTVRQACIEHADEGLPFPTVIAFSEP